MCRLIALFAGIFIEVSCNNTAYFVDIWQAVPCSKSVSPIQMLAYLVEEKSEAS
jgi:hypothetical protein